MTHGNLTIVIKSSLEVSQPRSFSEGVTTVIEDIFSDVGEEEGAAYMVMEYVSGPTLADAPPESAGEALRLACGICDALEHAHERGIVHRDLKPANLLVVQGKGRREVKLADLGIALGVHAQGAGKKLRREGKKTAVLDTITRQRA